MLVTLFFRPAFLLAGIAFFTVNPQLSAQQSLPISPQTPATVRIKQALRSPITLHVGQLTIKEFGEELRQQHGINVIIDRRALGDVGLTEKTPLGPIRLTDVSLASLLNTVLNGVELTWQIRNEGLVITTPEEAESNLETRVYPVSDLVVIPQHLNRQERERIRRTYGYDPYFDPFGYSADYDTLIEMITSTIEPDSWDEVGGVGSIEPFSLARVLVVSQTRSVHEKIGLLLTALREGRKLQGLTSGTRTHLRAAPRSGPRKRRYQPQAATATASHYVYRNSAKWRTPKIRE